MTKQLRNDPDRRMLNVAMACGAGFPEHDLPKLDRSQFPAWIEMLKQGEADTRQLRRRLEGLLQHERACPMCGSVVTGRPDRVYCGAACRQRARRGRQGASSEVSVD